MSPSVMSQSTLQDTEKLIVDKLSNHVMVFVLPQLIKNSIRLENSHRKFTGSRICHSHFVTLKMRRWTFNANLRIIVGKKYILLRSLKIPTGSTPEVKNSLMSKGRKIRLKIKIKFGRYFGT